MISMTCARGRSGTVKDQSGRSAAISSSSSPTATSRATNNGSERALRPCAVYRKITNGFRSQWAATLYADIRSVVEIRPPPLPPRPRRHPPHPRRPADPMLA